MVIADVKVSTKKGHSQDCKFLIERRVPFPGIKSYGGGFDWQSGAGIFRENGNPVAKLKEEYTAVLLRSDFDGNLKGDRTDYAGYEDNPGSIVYRGSDLGEMIIRLSRHRDGLGCDKIIVKDNYFGGTTDGKRKFIKEQIIPVLKDKIEENRQELYEQAVNKIHSGMNEKIQKAYSELEKLQEIADQTVERLREGIDNDNSASPR